MMTKNEFISVLRECLCGLGEDEINSTVDFYSEMIDERMEEGFSEEDAVMAAGAPEQIAERIFGESGGKPDVGPRKQKRRMKLWEIVLLVVGSPVWISLGAAVIVVILSLYIVLWSIVLVISSVTAALAAGSVLGLALAVMMFASGDILEATVYLGVAILSSGLTIFSAILCNKAITGAWYLTVRPIRALVRPAAGDATTEERSEEK